MNEKGAYTPMDFRGLTRVRRSTIFGAALLTLAAFAQFAACAPPQAPAPAAPVPTATPAVARPSIRVESVWARTSSVRMPAAGTPMGGMGGAMGGDAPITSAVYMVIVNDGQAADELVGASSDVAATAETHETTIVNDVMRMQPVKGIPVPAAGKVELKPGGYHVMLIGVMRDLKPGDRFTVKLRFQKSGEVTVIPEVRQP